MDRPVASLATHVCGFLHPTRRREARESAHLGLATELVNGTAFTYVAKMLTLGVDLAAQAKTTYAAVIDWSGELPTLVSVAGGQSNDDIVKLNGQVGAAGIDCPFGWPDAFVKVLQASAGRTDPARQLESVDDRRPLCYRKTDVHVLERTHAQVKPLSVSANFLGATAMRCSGLLWTLAGASLDRTGGSDGLYEVYPAASLWCWTTESGDGPSWAGYKKDRAVREEIVQWLVGGTGLTGDSVGDLSATDHGVDAVLAAVTARAAHLGLTDPAPRTDEVGSEGWIHLPRVGVRMGDLLVEQGAAAGGEAVADLQ